MASNSALLDNDTTTTTWHSGHLPLASDADRCSELSGGVNAGQLVVHYQPVVELMYGRVISVEALVRWQHPDLGLISPDQFLTLAERTGVLEDITTFVLDQAASQHAAWQAIGLTLPVAVNLSASSLRDRELLAKLIGTCRRHDIGHAGLSLDITETAIMADQGVAAVVLDQLAQSGFEIAIDDFGTGFSSLSFLRNLPVAVVKIDRSFVPDVAENEADAHIVRGLIEISHGLDKLVVAEGVENDRAREVLRSMGCEYGQGFHWSRPVSADELTAVLLRHRRDRVPAGAWTA